MGAPAIVYSRVMKKEMLFGVAGCFGGVDYESNERRYQLLEDAERLGFHAFWLNEEHFQETNRLCTSPLIVGAAFAARTSRIRIGTAVILLPIHNPLQLAEDIATLDVMSEGRVDVGISRGGQPRYYEGFGVNREERFDRFAEGVEFLRQAWTQDRVHHEGRFYNLAEVPVRPHPIQKPHPPIYVGTYDLPSVREFARQGLRIIEGTLQKPASVKAKIEAYNEAWIEAGHPGPPPVIPVHRMLYVGEDDESAWNEIQPFLRKSFEAKKKLPGAAEAGALLEIDQEWEAYAHEVAVIGGPETVIGRLRQLREDCGVTYVSGLVHFYWEMPGDLMRASMARIAEKVMPALNSG